MAIFKGVGILRPLHRKKYNYSISRRIMCVTVGGVGFFKHTTLLCTCLMTELLFLNNAVVDDNTIYHTVLVLSSSDPEVLK
jgi:hypothetical protein